MLVGWEKFHGQNAGGFILVGFVLVVPIPDYLCVGPSEIEQSVHNSVYLIV